MNAKSFDCVEMKRRGAERLRERLEGRSPDEQHQFWHRQTEALRERQRPPGTLQKAQIDNVED